MGVPKVGERFDIDCVVGLPRNDLEILVPQVENADRLGLATEPLDVVGVVTLLLGDLVGRSFLLSREYARGIALVVGSALSDCFDNHVDEPEAPRDDDHEQIEDEPAEGVLLGVTLACHCDPFRKRGCVGGIGEVSRAARYPLGADRAFPCTSPR